MTILKQMQTLFVYVNIPDRKKMSINCYDLTPDDNGNISDREMVTNFYELTPAEKQNIKQSSLPDFSSRGKKAWKHRIYRGPSYELYMNKTPFRIYGNGGIQYLFVYNKPCDIFSGSYSLENFEGCFKIYNRSDYVLFVDKYTVLEDLLLKYDFLESRFYPYDPTVFCSCSIT